MHSELSFVPKILLCGDEAEFISRVGKRSFNIVGHVKFFGEIDGKPLNFFQDKKIFFNGKFQDTNGFLKYLVTSDVDYLLFTNVNEFHAVCYFLRTNNFWTKKIITIDVFNSSTRNFFYDSEAEFHLFAWLKILSVKSLLDVDAYFSQGKVFTKLENDLTEIDCISETPLLPMLENIYAHAYKNFAEVGFKHYDAALIVERPPQDFIAAFNFLENFSDRVIIFVRNGSELEHYIAGNTKNFADIKALRTTNGIWLLLTRQKPPENFCMYVVTHKPTPHVSKLPEGYKIIHAVRTLNADLGYLGDDTGDNISELNPYLNEITALYWFWKNADDDVVGLSHYRRFFTESNDLTFAYDKILTRDAALKILDRYDIIIKRVLLHDCSQREATIVSSGRDLTMFAESVLKKYLTQAQPDYVDVFDSAWSLSTIYGCNMFVARRNVFDAYCKWLFSFLIDATRETLRMIDYKKLSTTQKRIMGFFAERLLHVWLMKNRLRVKELNGMLVNDI